MAQLIRQADIFGRLGSGIGQGLADQIPKEIERNRLASGLQQFSQTHQDQSPIQQLAQLSSIPGVTPQMIQSFSELAKQQQQRNAYARGSRGEQAAPQRSSPDFREMEFLDRVAPKGEGRTRQGQQERGQQQRSPVVSQQEYSPPQIVNQNPLDERTLTRPPWTPQQRDERVNQYINKGFLQPKAEELAADDETRDLSEPKAYQARFEELKQKQQDAKNTLGKYLFKKLQKGENEQFKDLSGEMLVNLERGMERDLRTNPKASVDDVANDWSQRALDLAKAKTNLDKLGKTTGIENLWKGDQTLNKLNEYQDIYKRAGNLEEYYNQLQTNFGLSPQGAASVAFPLNKGLKEFVSKVKSSAILVGTTREQHARKLAAEIEKHMTGDDSVLSVARAMKIKDPYFDEQAFFDQLGEDKDQLRLNERQRRELAEGPRDILPTWGDGLILRNWRL